MVKYLKLSLAFFVTLVLFTGCLSSSSSGGGGKQIASEADARKLAFAVYYAVTDSARYIDGDWTYSNKVVSGYDSGTATINGSFYYDYDGWDYAYHTYDNVVIDFNNFCNDQSYYPSITGMVTIDGTMTTHYDYTTSYSGYWDIVAENISLGNGYSGTANVAIRSFNGPVYSFGAIVEANGQSWTISQY